MIKIVTETDPRPFTTCHSLLFRYYNTKTERWHERCLSLKGLLQARNSGNNCDWGFYLNGWHEDFLFSYNLRIPGEITLTIKNLC